MTSNFLPTLNFYDIMMLSPSRKNSPQKQVFLLGDEAMLEEPEVAQPHLTALAASPGPAGPSRSESDAVPWLSQVLCSFLFSQH